MDGGKLLQNLISVCVQITKLDVETGELKTFSEDQLYSGDPIFVPRPGASDEVCVQMCMVIYLYVFCAYIIC